MRQTILSLVLLAVSTALWAQSSSDAPDPPAIPTKEERAKAEAAAKQADPEATGEEVDDVGIQAKQTVEGSTTVTEYSRGGLVYSVKMKQKYGATQYLDVKGDGQLQPTPEELYDNVNLPKWKLGNW